MIKLLFDENVDGKIHRGFVQTAPHIDAVRVQDVGLMGVSDPEILEWTAQRGRALVTHDRATIPAFFMQRLSAGLDTAGVILISDSMPVGPAIEELVLVVECTTVEQLAASIVYLPL